MGFGFTNPVLIDESDQIIAGHGRVQAAKLLGVARDTLINKIKKYRIEKDEE